MTQKVAIASSVSAVAFVAFALGVGVGHISSPPVTGHGVGGHELASVTVGRVAPDTRGPPSSGTPGTRSASRDAETERTRLDEKAVTAPRSELFDTDGRVPAAVQERLEQAIALVPVGQAPRGSHSVRGRVLTEDRKPVVGVVVHATLQADVGIPPVGYGDEHEESLVVKLYDLAVEHRRAVASRVEAVTDGAGDYVLTGLTEKMAYTLEASLSGWRIVATSGYAKKDYRPEGWALHTALGTRKTDVRAGEIVDFEARAMVDVPVSVVFADGTAPEVAKIYYRRPKTHRWYLQHWYPRASTVQLHPSDFEIKARVGDDRSIGSETQLITVTAGRRAEPLTFELAARTFLRGQLAFPADDAPEYAFVFALRFHGAKTPDADTLLSRGKSRIASGPSFKYLFKDTPPGRYLLGAGWLRDDVRVTRVVEVGEGDVVDEEIEIPPLQPGEYVTVRAFDPDGHPLTHVDITMRYQSDSGGGGASGPTINGADGSFRVLYPAVGNGTDALAAQDGAFFLELRSRTYGMKQVPVLDARKMEVHFEEPAWLEMVVDGYIGSELAGQLRLSLKKTGPRGRLSGVDATGRYSPGLWSGVEPDAGGSLQLGPLAPGDYLVHSRVVGKNSSWEVTVRPVTLRSGEQRVVLPIPEVRTLTVLFGAEFSGQSVVLQEAPDEEGWSGVLRARVDAEGKAVFQRLSRGGCTLVVPAAGLRMSADFSASVVEFRPDEPVPKTGQR